MTHWLKQDLNEPRPGLGVEARSPGTSVPKLIYQTGVVPQRLQHCIDDIRRLNPTWEHRVFDNNDGLEFISTHYGPKIRRYYESINPNYGPARADLFRYLALYATGGVYIDLKSTMAVPLDSVLQDNDVYLLSRWDPQHPPEFGRHVELFAMGGVEFEQWYIVAAAGHPFLKAAIDAVLRNIDAYNPVWHSVGKLGVLRLTGPIAYSLAIAPLLRDHDHRIVDSSRDLGFDYSTFRNQNGSFRYHEHATLVKQHYSQLATPLVLRGGLQDIFSHAYLLARRCAGKVWRYALAAWPKILGR